MRILIYTSAFPPVGYGASRATELKARMLAKAGHEITVVTARADGHPPSEFREGIRILRVAPARQMRSRATVRRVLELARNTGVDVIQGLDYLGDCAAMFRFRERPPICIAMATSISLRILRRSLAHFRWQYPFVILACLRAWRQWHAELRCIRSADFLLAPSRRVFEELDRQGVSATSIRTALPQPIEIPDSWENLETPRPTLLYVGRLDFGKGVGHLPSIFRLVRRRCPDCRLILAGGDQYARGIGSIRRWLERQFGADVADVTFTGPLSSAELDELYQSAWVVVVPSRWDSCSNVTLEAMARAKAVVVSPHGGMPELVEGTDAPVREPSSPEFAEAVLELLADDSSRHRLGAALREKAIQCYRMEVAAAAYAHFLEQALAQYRSLRARTGGGVDGH